jgi:hypothetical protein
MTDDLTDLLAEWGEVFEEELNRAVAEEDESLKRSLSLLAAVEAALKAADDWSAEATRLHQIAWNEADPQSRIAVSLRAQAFEDCARGFRAAITAVLATAQVPRG